MQHLLCNILFPLKFINHLHSVLFLSFSMFHFLNRIEYLYPNDIIKLLKITNDMQLKEIDGKEQTKEKRNPLV